MVSFDTRAVLVVDSQATITDKILYFVVVKILICHVEGKVTVSLGASWKQYCVNIAVTVRKSTNDCSLCL